MIRTRVPDHRGAHVCVTGAWVKLGFGWRTNCLSRQISHGSGALLELSLPSFLFPASLAVQTMDFIGTPSYVANVAQQVENERNFETMAMMAGAAVTARATFNMGGRIVNFV